MATRSAAKAHRQSLKKRLRNRIVKSATKTAVKRAVESIASGDMAVARDVVRTALQTLDRAAQKGVVHANNAGRRKSRLLLRYNAAVAAMQVITEKPVPVKAKAASRSAKPAGKKAPVAKSTAKKAKK